MAERLFHLVPHPTWAALAPAQPWSPPSLANEGFVHLSFAAQLAGTAAAHFTPHQRLWLLELDSTSLGAQLLLEPSRGGALFPHLYRAFERGEVRAHWDLLRQSDGSWNLPSLARDPRDDRPLGRSGAPAA